MNIKSKLVMAFLIVLMVTQLGCVHSDEKQEEEVQTENIRTDLEPLQKRFPNLKGIQSAQWEWESLTEERSAPGPSDYCLKGIIVLNGEVAKEYQNKYEWIEVTDELEAKYVDLSEYENKIWYVSNEMKEDMISAGYMGEIYLSENVLWFDITTF